MQLGAIDYLEKPIHPTDLVQIVRAYALLGMSRSRQAQS
jgi:FixJ family two-component response regulator